MNDLDRKFWTGVKIGVAYGLAIWVVIYTIARAVWHAL